MYYIRLHNCVADLDEYVGVCTCMFVFSPPSIPPSLLPSVCILSFPIPLPIFFCITLSLSPVSSDNVIPHLSDDVMPCPQVRFCYKSTVHFVHFVLLEHSVCMYLFSPLYHSIQEFMVCLWIVLNSFQDVFIHLYVLPSLSCCWCCHTYHLHTCWSHIVN